MVTKGASDHTYTLFRVDIEVKAKFKGSLFKVRDKKANFIVEKKSFPTNATKAKAFAL